MDLCLYSFSERSHEPPQHARIPGFKTVEVERESETRVGIPGAQREHTAHKLSLRVSLPGPHGGILACRAEATLVRDVAIADIGAVISGANDRKVLALAHEGEPTMRHFPHRGTQPREVRELRFDSELLPDRTAVLRPLLTALATAETLTWLCNRDDYMWRLLALLQSVQTLEASFLRLLERAHLIRAYLIFQQIGAMFLLDSSRVARYYDGAARAVCTDLAYATTILDVHGLTPSFAVPSEDQLVAACSEMLGVWERKALRGSLLVAAMTLVVTLGASLFR